MKKISLILMLLISTLFVYAEAATISIEEVSDRPTKSIVRPGGIIFVTTFKIIVGNEDIYYPAKIGGIFSFNSKDRSANWLSKINTIEIIVRNNFSGSYGYGLPKTDNTIDGGILFEDYNLIFNKNTTNTVYVGLNVDETTDWQDGDEITFSSSEECKFSDGNGKTIVASGEIKNTVTLATKPYLEILVTNNNLVAHGLVPCRYNQYQLVQSQDMTNWVPVLGSKGLERTIMMGDFRFPLPKPLATNDQSFYLLKEVK